MNTCDTCAFWTRDDTGAGAGDCSSPKWHRGYNHGPTDILPDGVWVEDDEGWAFMTGPKFGCIHWSSVPQSPAQSEKA